MSRVTPAEVRALFATTLDDSVIELWIDGANAIVDANSEYMPKSDEAYLTKVELQLSTHFVYLDDPSYQAPVSKSKLDVLETTYAVNNLTINAIESTKYGKLANMLSGGAIAETDGLSATVTFA